MHNNNHYDITQWSLSIAAQNLFNNIHLGGYGWDHILLQLAILGQILIPNTDLLS